MGLLSPLPLEVQEQSLRVPWLEGGLTAERGSVIIDVINFGFSAI